MKTGALFNLEALVLLIIFAPWIIKAIRRLFGGFKNMIRIARKSSAAKSSDQYEAEARRNGTFIKREGNDVYTKASPEFEEQMHKLGQYLVEQERAKKAQDDPA